MFQYGLHMMIILLVISVTVLNTAIRCHTNSAEPGRKIQLVGVANI